MGGPAFALPAGATGDISVVGVSAVTTLSMNSAGTFSIAGNTLGVLQSGNWVTPTLFAPGAYTIRVHQNSGTAITGSALDSDLALSSNRSWTLTEAAIGTLTANLTLTLKDGGGNVVATATFNITAQRLS
jgi:hypothetical protein